MIAQSVQLPCPRCLTAGISQVPGSQAPGTTVRNFGEGTVEREDFGQDAVDPTGSAQGCCGVPVHEAMHVTWRDVECWLREDSHQVGPFNCSRPCRIVPRAHVEAHHSALPKCVTASGKGRRKPCRSCRALVHSAGCPCGWHGACNEGRRKPTEKFQDELLWSSKLPGSGGHWWFAAWSGRERVESGGLCTERQRQAKKVQHQFALSHSSIVWSHTAHKHTHTHTCKYGCYIYI